MSNWREMLKEAKELFDDGLLDESEYKAEKIRIMALRSQSTNPGTTLPGRPPSIDTMGTIVSQTPLAGRPDLGGVDNLGTFVQQQTLSNIGNYRLLAEIGQGGMGTVYRARHTVESFAKKTGDVVIKLMNPELASNPDFAERFISEAALGRSIRHPNFVEIHDVIVEQETNTLAIVMNLIDGQPLSDIIPKEGMEFEKAKPIVEQLCKAIDHLHSQGIIHRDLKPENIIVQRDGTPIILDMGIAKDTTDSNMSQTSTGTAMGTPLYMAPEQMDAKNVTSAADRYALGLIVYQLLSGEFPWSSTAGPAEILTKKFTGRLESLSQSEHFNRNAVMDLLHCEASKRPQTCEIFLIKWLEDLHTNASTTNDNNDMSSIHESEQVALTLPIVEPKISSSVPVKKPLQSHNEIVVEPKNSFSKMVLGGLLVIAIVVFILERQGPVEPSYDSIVLNEIQNQQKEVLNQLQEKDAEQIRLQEELDRVKRENEETQEVLKQQSEQQQQNTEMVDELNARRVYNKWSTDVTAFNPDWFTASRSDETMIVATGRKYVPMFDTTGSTPRGIDIDIATELADRLGKKSVRFVTSSSARQEAKKGNVDLALAAVSITEERKQIHLFSVPYFTTGQVVVMRNTGRNSLRDLSSKKCGYHSPLYKNLLKKQKCTMRKFRSSSSTIQALREGDVDYIILEDQSVPKDLWKSAVVEPDEYGIVFPNSAVSLKHEVDGHLKDMIRDGTMRTIQNRYN